MEQRKSFQQIILLKLESNCKNMIGEVSHHSQSKFKVDKGRKIRQVSIKYIKENIAELISGNGPQRCLQWDDHREKDNKTIINK